MSEDELLHILLVEDEPDHALIVRDLLEEAWESEFSWTTRESLGAALRFLDDAPAPDLILLDLRLPDSMGIETLQSLLKNTSNVPVVVLTSLNDSELGAYAVREGAQDYIVKSDMTSGKLASTILYAIERHQNSLQLQERNRDLLNFAHIVAHEIRNPVNSIHLAAQVLKRSSHHQDEESREMLSIINRQVNDVSAFISDMLQFSSGGAAGDSDEADGNVCLKNALGGLEEQIRAGDVRLSHDSLPLFQVKTLHLQHILHNLISNAIKYGKAEEPHIHIGIIENADKAFHCISVQDNGPGIPAQSQNNLFTMFSRLSSADSAPGLGIGLAYCRRVVESYGGEIGVDSNEGKGSSFYFSLPAA